MEPVLRPASLDGALDRDAGLTVVPDQLAMRTADTQSASRNPQARNARDTSPVNPAGGGFRALFLSTARK